MPTPDEKNVLKILDEEGGELTEGKIVKHMGVRLDYMRIILESMGRRDFIDVFASGKVRLAEKGWRALGKSLNGTGPSGPSESSEEKYKRWLTGKAPQKLKKEKFQEKKDVATVLRKTSSENLSPQEKFKRWAAE